MTDVDDWVKRIEQITDHPVRCAGKNKSALAAMQFDVNATGRRLWPFGLIVHRDGADAWYKCAVASKVARDKSVPHRDLMAAALAQIGVPAVEANRRLRRAVKVDRIAPPP